MAGPRRRRVASRLALPHRDEPLPQRHPRRQATAAAAPIPPFEPPEPSRRGEVTWLQPYPDAWLDRPADRALDPSERQESRETVELAFIAALQRLPPRQTAVVVLCDVLDFSTAEAATMLSTSPTTAKGLLQRVRASLAPEVSGPEPAPGPGSAAERALAQRFSDAFLADDIDAIVALLTDDAWLAMPPAPHEYHGRTPSPPSCGRAPPGAGGARCASWPPDPTPSPRSRPPRRARQTRPSHRPPGPRARRRADRRHHALPRPRPPCRVRPRGYIEQGQDEQRRP